MNKKMQLQGTVSVHPKGFGFVTTADEQEFFVSPKEINKLLIGDLVRFTPEEGNRPGQMQATKVELIKRPSRLILGTIRYDRGLWLLDADEACFVQLVVRDLSYAPVDQVVAVRVDGAPPLLSNSIEVKVERVLGPRDRKHFELDYALATFDFSPVFNKAVIEAAERFPEVSVPAALKEGRKDLRELPLVTIDGSSTKDFDDAVYAEKTPEGFRLVVAIADVSHYVKPGSALDKEARKRATSVYLPGKTVPMLPEALSNGLCSLNPGANRLVFVADCRTSLDGTLEKAEFYKAVMASHARLTYDQVAEFLANPAQFSVPTSVAKNLTCLNELYFLLDAQRKTRGVMDFEDPEPKLKTREDGEWSLEWEHRNVAHKIVEEAMLLANQAVAQELVKSTEDGVFRHQPLPSEEDWKDLSDWCATLGIKLPANPELKALAIATKTLQGTAQEQALKLRIRKAMQPAQYDGKETGHFSLGYPAYTHFTSPIRRYADLETHRLLAGLKASTKAITEHCSERSKAARFAERQVWDTIKKTLLARDVSPATTMDSQVVSSGRRGVRVVARDWQCSLLVPAQELLESGYFFDTDNQEWRLNKKPLEVGCAIRIKWTRLERDKSRIELLAELVA